MARKNVFYLRLEDKEMATLNHLVSDLSVQDRSEVMRGLIWQAGLNFGILTKGDIRDLATSNGRERKILIGET